MKLKCWREESVIIFRQAARATHARPRVQGATTNVDRSETLQNAFFGSLPHACLTCSKNGSLDGPSPKRDRLPNKRNAAARTCGYSVGKALGTIRNRQSSDQMIGALSIAMTVRPMHEDKLKKSATLISNHLNFNCHHWHVLTLSFSKQGRIRMAMLSRIGRTLSSSI